MSEVEKHLTLHYIPSKAKVSLLKQLEQVWEHLGTKPERLLELEPDIPESGKDLWDIFWELRTDEVISWTDIKSYCEFNDITLEPHEIQIILAMNSKCNSYIRKQETPKDEPKKPNPKNTRR